MNATVFSGSLALLLTGCIFGNNDDATGDTAVIECDVNPDVNPALGPGPASGPVSAAGLDIFVDAQWRYDAANNTVGSLDDPNSDSELQGILITVVPAVEPANASEPGCNVIVPITPQNTTVTSGAGFGLEVTALLSDLQSNCADPAYATIQQYVGGDPTTLFANIIQLTLAQPTPEAVDAITSVEGQSAEQFVMGGTIQLRDDFPMTDTAVLAETTDECGVFDDTSQRVEASEVLPNGPTGDMVFRYFGVAFVELTITPA